MSAKNITGTKEDDLDMNTTPDARIGHIIAEETVQTVLLIIVSVVGTWLCLYKILWQVSGDPCLVAAAATLVIVACLWLTRWRGLRAVNLERHLLSGFLAAMPLVYLTRYLFASAGQGTSSWFWVEALGVLVFAALALLGVKLSPWFLAIGIVAHGLAWDTWHYRHYNGRRAKEGYPQKQKGKLQIATFPEDIIPDWKPFARDIFDSAAVLRRWGFFRRQGVTPSSLI